MTEAVRITPVGSGGEKPLSVAEVLRRAADLIEPEGRWTQGAARKRDEHGRAVCFCALGAIWEAVERPDASEFGATDALEHVIGARIPRWNDTPGRTQAEVVAALRKAADLAEAGPLGGSAQ